MLNHYSNYYNDLSDFIKVERTHITLKENWCAVRKPNYSLIMAIAYREDSTFNVTGFSKHIDGNYIIFFSDSNNGSTIDIETAWVKH